MYVYVEFTGELAPVLAYANTQPELFRPKDSLTGETLSLYDCKFICMHNIPIINFSN